MAFRNKLIVAVILVVIASIGISMVNIPLPTKEDEKRIFPGIIGDMILKNSDIGIYFVRNITLYDDFRGNITQGYMATYSNLNGTMIIFLAQAQDNITANRSLKDMVIRAGFNESTYNESAVPRINNTITITKLPAKNPEAFAMQKDWNQTLHYVFSKKDKVYWIGFSPSPNLDIPYQMGMIVEVYKNVDKKKGDFGSFDI